jgi:hypothetical protein
LACTETTAFVDEDSARFCAVISADGAHLRESPYVRWFDASREKTVEQRIYRGGRREGCYTEGEEDGVWSRLVACRIPAVKSTANARTPCPHGGIAGMGTGPLRIWK